MNRTNGPLSRCQNKVKRLNLKSKRKRNLVKKAIELTLMLDMDILVVMRDNDTEKYYKYMSGNKRKGHFTWEQTIKDIEDLNRKGIAVKMYDDDDYFSLK